MKKQFAVIGLGVFGRHVARKLTQLGHEVLAVDLDPDLVDSCSGQFEMLVRADATDEEALRELRLERVGCAVVAIGADAVEASIMTTTVLRQIGVPLVVARSVSPLHARVLRAVGAHEVINPEEEMGVRLARRLAEPNVLERMNLGTEAELAEIESPAEFVGKTLVELNVRRKHALTVVAIRRGGDVLATLDSSDRIQSGDVLVVIGSRAAIARLASRA